MLLILRNIYARQSLKQ